MIIRLLSPLTDRDTTLSFLYKKEGISTRFPPYMFCISRIPLYSLLSSTVITTSSLLTTLSITSDA